MMKFFVPYHGSQDPYVFYQYINLLKDYIDGIYFSNFLLSKNPTKFTKESEPYTENFISKEKMEYVENNTLILLNLLKNINIEKFYLLNKPKKLASKKDYDEADHIIEKFENLITGFSVSNLWITEHINFINPDYKIDISANSLTHNPTQMAYWKKNFNLYSINVPRMCSRDIDKLKEFKQTAEKLNVKIKLILNEACVYGCPFETLCRNVDQFRYCEKYKEKYFLLKSNWVSPSQLKNIENLVDIGKIVYRGDPNDKIFNCLMHYINGDDDCDISEILHCGYKKINIKKIPKKIFTCKCSECKSLGLGKCEICEKFMEHYSK